MKLSNYMLKKIIILIWSLWILIVALSNVADALRNTGILPDHFKFVSGNFGYIQAATQIYNFPVWLNAVLFLLAIILEILMCVFFFKLFFKMKEGNDALVNPPFFFGVVLFGGFLIMDEFLIAYDRLGGIEQNHFTIFTALIASYLLIKLLPGDK